MESVNQQVANQQQIPHPMQHRNMHELSYARTEEMQTPMVYEAEDKEKKKGKKRGLFASKKNSKEENKTDEQIQDENYYSPTQPDKKETYPPSVGSYIVKIAACLVSAAAVVLYLIYYVG